MATLQGLDAVANDAYKELSLRFASAAVSPHLTDSVRMSIVNTLSPI